MNRDNQRLFEKYGKQVIEEAPVASANPFADLARTGYNKARAAIPAPLGIGQAGQQKAVGELENREEILDVRKEFDKTVTGDEVKGHQITGFFNILFGPLANKNPVMGGFLPIKNTELQKIDSTTPYSRKEAYAEIDKAMELGFKIKATGMPPAPATAPAPASAPPASPSEGGWGDDSGDDPDSGPVVSTPEKDNTKADRYFEWINSLSLSPADREKVQQAYDEHGLELNDDRQWVPREDGAPVGAAEGPPPLPKPAGGPGSGDWIDKQEVEIVPPGKGDTGLGGGKVIDVQQPEVPRITRSEEPPPPTSPEEPPPPTSPEVPAGGMMDYKNPPLSPMQQIFKRKLDTSTSRKKKKYTPTVGGSTTGRQRHVKRPEDDPLHLKNQSYIPDGKLVEKSSLPSFNNFVKSVEKRA